VFALIEKYYEVDKELIGISDLFIIKCESSEQNLSEKYLDSDIFSGNIFSFNILLNENTDFDGGGTGIYSPWGYHEYHLSKGDILVHPGFLYHRGIPITRGICYILVGFLNINDFFFQRKNHVNMTILNYDKTDNRKDILYNPIEYISKLFETQIGNINVIERGFNKQFSELKDNHILIIIPKNRMKMKINEFLIDNILVFECCANIKWHDKEEFQYILLEKKNVIISNFCYELNDGIFLIDDIIDCEMCDKIVNEIDNHTKNIPFINDKNHYLDKYIYECFFEIFFHIYNKTGVICNTDSGFILQKDCNERQLSSADIQQVSNIFCNIVIIITLNEDYEEGEIYFPIQNFKRKLMKGQAIVFPPYWTHKYMFNSTKKNTYRYTLTSYCGTNKNK